MFRPLGFRRRGFGHGHLVVRTVALLLLLLVAGSIGRAMIWDGLKAIVPLVVIALALGAVKIGGSR